MDNTRQLKVLFNYLLTQQLDEDLLPITKIEYANKTKDSINYVVMIQADIREEFLFCFNGKDFAIFYGDIAVPTDRKFFLTAALLQIYDKVIDAIDYVGRSTKRIDYIITALEKMEPYTNTSNRRGLIKEDK